MFKCKKRLQLALMVLGVAIGLSGCHRPSDETVIRQHIDRAELAAEQVDAGALADQLTDDFSSDDDGTLDRNGLLNVLRVAKLRGESIHAVIGPVDIEARGERYVARFSATLTSGGKFLPTDMGVYTVETAWRRDGRDWRCYSAHWTP